MKVKFKRTVDSGDLEGARISLANEMMLDPRGESFNEMRIYAEKTFPNLYDAHDGAILDSNKDHWNEALLFSTKNALDDNFSKERLDFYFDLAKEVLKEKATALDKEISIPSYSKEMADSYDQAENHRQNMKPLYMGLTVGGLIIGGAGVIMGKSIITVVGLVGAAIGGSLIYKDKRK